VELANSEGRRPMKTYLWFIFLIALLVLFFLFNPGYSKNNNLNLLQGLIILAVIMASLYLIIICTYSILTSLSGIRTETRMKILFCILLALFVSMLAISVFTKAEILPFSWILVIAAILLAALKLRRTVVRNDDDYPDY
jgi:lysylphosphatidylglycerol synthetase-like protein (DUF2156 family)